MHPLVKGKVIQVSSGADRHERNLRHLRLVLLVGMLLVLALNERLHRELAEFQTLAIDAERPSGEAQHGHGKSDVSQVAALA